MYAKFAALTALVASASAQQVCSLTAGTQPSLSWSTCTAGGSCTNKSASVTIDANWRWTHALTGANNCYDGNTWNNTICSTGKDCAAKCCVDGADYSSTYGITASGNSLDLKFVQKGSYSTNIGSRTYLMETASKYQSFTLLGNEFTFDVDVSAIGCGLNGALYFNPSTNDANAGAGSYGTCCSEMDIWEANNVAAAYTPHPCTTIDQTRCSGDACGGTYSSDRYSCVCDPDGCDFNSYRMGDKTFYGAGGNVDTTKKMTVVTQFLKNAAGELSEIKRFYVQNGKIIPNSQSKVAGVTGNSITKDFCNQRVKAFGDVDDFTAKGGLVQMGKALAKPMVLVMSIWDDHAANMLWLDSTYPGVPSEIEASAPNSHVAYSNIRFGPINSTVAGLGSVVDPGTGGGNSGTTAAVSSIRTTSTTASVRTSTSTSTAAGGATTGIAQWQQCGGIGFAAGACKSPYTCTVLNPYYSQCL
ncbi:exoglucanase 1 precursor [Lasiosphaeris hirsuta]|uniref:Glucanase n=1 Tax=Lasiosphaeris hirsuta TaxID=260670 RepID=A0AA40AG20_9PEZI|nr:exoglucanase 1 precursor [Lasiosphaeris hirsuta]